MVEKLRPCRICGARVPAGDFACRYCGSVLHVPSSASLVELRTLSSCRPNTAMREAASEVLAAVSLRKKEERHIWPYSIVLPTLLGIVVMVFYAIVMAVAWDEPWFIYAAVCFYAAYIAMEVWLAVVIYRFIDRNNRHFLRERRFEKALIGLIKQVPGTEEKTPDAERYRDSLAGTVERPTRTDRQRSPIGWVFWFVIAPNSLSAFGIGFQILTDEVDAGFSDILLLIGVVVSISLAIVAVTLILMARITEDIAVHDASWSGFANGTRISLSKLGYRASNLNSGTSLESRNVLLYVVLSILTGVVFLYWMYAIVKDMNLHLGNQRAFEDNVAAEVRGWVGPGAVETASEGQVPGAGG